MYKLILMDFSMPEMNGTEATVEIRRFLDSVGLPQPYICCCSAYTDETYKKQAIDSGMDDFLNKPVAEERIQELLLGVGLI